MSFFNITQLGYQNKLTNSSLQAQQCPIRSKTQFDFRALPPLVDRNMPPRCLIPDSATARYPPGHQGSQKELARLRWIYARNPKGPIDLQRIPITSSHEYGWFLKGGPIKERLPWTQTQRYPHVHSEITQFVRSMAMTDRDFKLF